jgi:hypothetical protein
MSTSSRKRPLSARSNDDAPPAKTNGAAAAAQLARVAGAAHATTPPTVVNWSIADMLAAFEDLTTLLMGNPEGAFGYKASLVRTIIEPLVVSASRDDAKLKQRYRKHVPKEGGGDMPLPDEQNGRQLPLTFWCTDPDAYTREVNAIRGVVHAISFPVRFTYDEVANHREPVRDPLNNNTIVAWQGVRGAFWRNLTALIDRPAYLADVHLPTPQPSKPDLSPEDEASEND